MVLDGVVDPVAYSKETHRRALRPEHPRSPVPSTPRGCSATPFS
jgi:hypothetical protein